MKRINKFLAVTLALIIASVMTVSLVKPVLAQAYLFVYPDDGEIGDEFEVYGSDFVPSYSYDVYFSGERASVGEELDQDVLNYERLGRVTTAADGTFYGYYYSVPSRLTDGDEIENVRGGTYYVYVTYANQDTIRARAEFEVEVVTLITLSIEGGVVGSEVSIDGSGFAASETVTIEFDGSEVGTTQTDSAGSFSDATFTVPESSRGSHTVEAIDESASTAAATFTTRQSIAVSPESGVVGDEVTVNGTGFQASKAVTVTFDQSEIATATTNSLGSFSVSFSVPSRGSGSYTIEASDGTYEDDASFEVSFEINLIPNTGFTGSQVVVTGTGFLAGKHGIPVLFVDADKSEIVTTVSTDSYGTFTANFVVPVRPAGTYKVSVSDGTNTGEASFSITTSATISPETSPASPGNVGSQVTVSGVGFTGGRTLTVKYDGEQVATGMVNLDGSFSVVFAVPASKGGAHTIIVSDQVNTKEFTFVMESTPPQIPAPLKPEMGIKAEAETYFDWEDVTDPSGVTYTLQIATRDDFSEDSIVLEKTGLTESEYTLTKEERLPSVGKDSPYYWHIRAEDGAGNISGWTGLGTFTVGGFSFEMGKPVMYTLVGVGALVLFAVGFWLGRRTAYY